MERGDDCGAGGRDQFERNVRLADRDPLQNFQSGRAGQWILTVRRAKRALTFDETRKIDPLDLERFESDTAQNDVDDRVECADFVKLHLFDRGSMNLRLSFTDSLEDRCRMLFDKIRELAASDQRANLRKAPGRTRPVAGVIKSLVILMFVIVMLVTVMLVTVMLVTMMLMTMMLMIVMLMIVMLMVVMLVMGMRLLRGIVGCSGVNIEFYAGDACAGLSLEMEVAIAQFQFRELPFESRRGDSQIGQ